MVSSWLICAASIITLTWRFFLLLEWDKSPYTQIHHIIGLCGNRDLIDKSNNVLYDILYTELRTASTDNTQLVVG